MDQQRQYDDLKQPSSDGATSGSQSRNDDVHELKDAPGKAYLK